MRVVYPRCGGIEVHPQVVVVTMIITNSSSNIRKEQRTFSTRIADLFALDSWLEEHQIDIVALKSTARMRQLRITDILETGRTVVYVNMHQLEAIPLLPEYNATVKDSEWLAIVLRHGLLPVTSRTSPQDSELSELLRYRKALVLERDREIQQLRNVLEIIRSKEIVHLTTAVRFHAKRYRATMLAREQGSMKLLDLVSDQLQEQVFELKQRLSTGQIPPHYQFLIYHMLKHIDFLEGVLATLQNEVEQRLSPTAFRVTF